MIANKGTSLILRARKAVSALVLLISWAVAATALASEPPDGLRTSAECGQRIELSYCRDNPQGLALSALSDDGPDCDFLWITRYQLEGSVREKSVWVRPDRDTCYLVQVNCPGGCSATDTICVRVLDPPLAVWSVPDFACARDTISVRLESAFSEAEQVSVDWGEIDSLEMAAEAGATLYRVRASVEGFYILNARITNAAGCASEARTVLRVRPKPSVNAGADLTVCQGDSARLEGSSPDARPGPCRIEWRGVARFDSPYQLQALAWADESATLFLTAECNGCYSEPDSMALTVRPRPVIVADTHQVDFCRDAAGVQLPVRVEGGTPPYFAKWSPPYALDDPLSVAPFAAPEQDTAWTLELLDASRCAATPLTIRARVHELPIAAAGPNFYRCLGLPDTIRLRGQVWQPDSVPYPDGELGRFTFAWEPAYGLSDSTLRQPLARPDSTTIYTLRVRDRLTGCTNRATTLDTLSTATVYVIERPTANAGADSVAVCLNDAVQIGGVSGGGQDLVYVWSPTRGLSNSSAANPYASPDFSTLYKLQVFNGECASDMDSIFVQVWPKPVVRLDAPIDICEGDTAFIRVDAQGGNTPYVFSWSEADAVFPIDSSLYGWQPPYPGAELSVSVSDRYCEGSAPYTVSIRTLATPFIRLAENQLLLCRKDSIVIGSWVECKEQGFHVAWSPADSISSTVGLNPTVWPDQTTLYKVRANLGRCETTDSALVTVAPKPTVEVEGERAICAGDTVRLFAKADQADGWRWYWRDSNGTDQERLGPNLQDIPPASTRYIVEARLGPCFGRDTVRVRVYPQAEAAIDVSSVSGCGPWTVAFRSAGTGGLEYWWDFGNDAGYSSLAEPTYRYLIPGVWPVRLIVNGGGPCPDTADFALNLRATPAEISSDAFLIHSQGDTLYMPHAEISVGWRNEAVVSSVWDFGDGATLAGNPVRHVYERAGDYWVRLIWEDSAGCSRTDSLPVLYVREPQVTPPTVFTPNGDGVNDEWRAEYLGAETFRLKVFDRWGRLLYESDKPAEGWKGLDKSGKEAPAGQYLFHLQIGLKNHRGGFTLIR